MKLTINSYGLQKNLETSIDLESTLLWNGARGHIVPMLWFVDDTDCKVKS